MTDFGDEFACTAASWARLYRDKGMQIVPAWIPGEQPKGLSWKRPRLEGWTGYQEALIPDELFNRWYGPGGLFVSRDSMGMICGRASDNLLVIDLDLYKNLGAGEWWDQLMLVHNNNMELETVEQITGGGGRQKIYRAPPGWAIPTNNILSMGIDIKGQGGFVMLPPSLHESGNNYAWLDGQSPEDMDFTMAPDWLLEAVEELIEVHGGVKSAANGKGNGHASQAAYDAFGNQTDGRESYMRDMVWRCVVKWHRACPIQPSAGESARKAREEYEVYERKVTTRQPHPADLTKTQMLDREGRGWEVWWSKWQRAVRQWTGKVFEEAGKPDPNPDVSRETYQDFTDEFAKAEEQAKTTGNIFPYLDIDQILAMPDPAWAIEGLITERALGFIFGPPGSLKTFLALDIALTIATSSAQWWNRTVNSHGAVIYLCREGTRSLKFRLKAWELHRKAALAGRPFYLIEAPINFMQGADVGVLLATVEAIVAKAGVPVAAVFVDTVSRVLPGAKENQQEDMSLFVGACEILQQRFQCLVVGVHHTNKNGGIRGSTVIPGAGDFLIETRREPGADVGSIVIQKVKDGEDGQELPFRSTKVSLGDIGGNTSLVVDPDGSAKAAGVAGFVWPDVMVCREILDAIDDQWRKGQPWCHATNSSRSAVSNIMNRWKLKRDLVKQMLAQWTANSVIEEVERDPKSHVKGYRKLLSI